MNYVTSVAKRLAAPVVVGVEGVELRAVGVKSLSGFQLSGTVIAGMNKVAKRAFLFVLLLFFFFLAGGTRKV